MYLESSNFVGTVKPLKHGNVAPQWTDRGRTHQFLIVLTYKVADLLFRGAVKTLIQFEKGRGVGGEKRRGRGPETNPV